MSRRRRERSRADSCCTDVTCRNVAATLAFFSASDGKVLSSGMPEVRKREMSSSADASSIGPTGGARAKIGWALCDAATIACSLSGASGRCSA
jgi:hypothetical protein